jgi:hypothetical protein
MTDLWSWVLRHEADVRIVTTIAFGLSSAVVAWVAVRLNYYANFGAKPKVIVVWAGGSRRKDSDEQYATFTCRIQNRHKYAIEGRLVTARLRTAEVRKLLKDDKRLFDGWVLHSDGQFLLQLEGKTEPGEHDLFEGRFPAKLGTQFDVPLVRFSYFDPIAGDWYTVKNSWRNRTAWRRRELRWMARAALHRLAFWRYPSMSP